MSKNIIFASVIASIIFTTVLSTNISFAESNSQTEITPINNSIGLEKTTLQMQISENNKLPWGFVEGKIANHVAGHPVIIQIFDNDEIIPGNSVGAVHFAQTVVNEDGSYEYKFRVLDSNNGKITKIFDGNYTVKIFKVVYLQSNLDVI
ncbi:hypothetical protein [Nitrosarchaeum sp.]|uniref:hypothetical protein n=1 Tax=Nitrosarchaeum sp. TaxID=2026886 RepID=UPI00247E13C8|nr:hypothetical protein [Nitrosarchaeum sp.]MCV0412507.1 hypothetical protein [Nitrosarchaeum sp.]